MKDFIIITLAVWRIVNLIVWERGPFDILGRFRNLLQIQTVELVDGTLENYSENELGKLFSCNWCLSPYIGFLTWLIYKKKFGKYLILPFALSAGSLVLNKYIKE